MMFNSDIDLDQHSDIDLEQHLDTESIITNITDAALIVTLSGKIERCNASAIKFLEQYTKSQTFNDLVEEVSAFKTFDAIRSKAKEITGLQVCRLKKRSNGEECLTFFSSLRSRLDHQVVAILLQFDYKVSKFNQLQTHYSSELGEQAKLIRKFQSDGIHDPLTGLKNRRYMDEYLHSQIELNLRHKIPATLAVIDIDHFKKVNDTYGHSVGDTVICVVADELERRARDSDAVCRWGGEEFCIFLNHVSGEAAQQVLNEIRKNIEGLTIETNECSFHITASIGASELRSNENKPITMTELFERADHALYKAKNSGRNRVVLKLEAF